MKTIFFSILFTLFAVMAGAQQNTGFRESNLVSPQINADNSVTFRIKAPRAKQVMVWGDWAANNGRGEMKKGKDDVWEYTTPALPSEMYTYRFVVDGVAGLDPLNPFTRRDVGNVFSIFFIDGGAGDYYQVHDVPHGTVSAVWYHSNVMQADRRLSVYTPPFYGKENKSYPVLYLLHGSGGDELAWVELGNVARIMDNLIAEGKAEPMIVVMPNGNPNCEAAPGEWSKGMYKPSFMGHMSSKPVASMEESFPDIVKYVEKNYRVKKGKANRAICGLSMGGGHSFGISKLYPGMFDYVGLFSAAIFLPGSNDPQQTMLEKMNNDAEFGRQMAELFGKHPKLYWIAIGKTDFLYKSNEDYRKYLDEKGYPYEYLETEGGHIWRNWRVYLTQFAQKIFK